MRNTFDYFDGDAYLTHHGIKGMKWGIRRYQNPDGTLTEEGKKRYYNDDGSLTKAGEKENNKRAEDAAQNWYKAYNSAAERFNEKIDDINERHDGGERGEKYGMDKWGNVDYHSNIGQKYIKELDTTWRSIYTEELKKQFKPSLTTGYEWVSNVPQMDSFSIHLLAKNKQR